jgi:trimethylamine--corrinoid protein Co-methyltransferase
MESEYHYPHSVDRGARADWEAAGAMDMRERARRQAREILLTQYQEVIHEEIDKQIRQEFNIHLPRDVMHPGGYLK